MREVKFSAIPGLHKEKERLIHAYQSGKVAHAQLFVGVEGAATLPMALAYLSYLFCEAKTDQDSCGICSNCKRIDRSSHPDIHYVMPKISVIESKYEMMATEALTSFRSFLMENPFASVMKWVDHAGFENKNLFISRQDSRQIFKTVSMQSVEGGYKVILIWLPELMHDSASNAILKILEEPPRKTLFFLVTNHFEKLLTTITSRTQLVQVGISTEEEIQKFLAHQGVEVAQAVQIALQSQGKPGHALALARDGQEMIFQDFQGWMLDCYHRKYGNLLKRSEDFSKADKNYQKSSLHFALTILRNAIVTLSGKDIVYASEEENKFISKFSNLLGLNRLDRVYFFINKAMRENEQNANSRIMHLDLSIHICKLIHQDPLGSE